MPREHDVITSKPIFSDIIYPRGYRRCTDIYKFYKIRKNKKKYDELHFTDKHDHSLILALTAKLKQSEHDEYIEPDFGKEYMIYSYNTDTWYKRLFMEFTDIEWLIESIEFGIIAINE